ncbi:hypothetical protein V1477_004823 [Vespula maculifrons]|uniref:Uncharacterized protein n=1 Tax=Vespula maculifrons TaxID=7453 RepID=A0ABD2CMW6_VESMC
MKSLTYDILYIIKYILNRKKKNKKPHHNKVLIFVAFLCSKIHYQFFFFYALHIQKVLTQGQLNSSFQVSIYLY